MPKHLTGLAIDLYKATLEGESYETAKRRLALDLSTEDWADLDTVYDQSEAAGWDILNEAPLTLTAPERALILAALRYLQDQMTTSGSRSFWRREGSLAAVATNKGTFSLPTSAAINALCPRISGLATAEEPSGEEPMRPTDSNTHIKEEV